jgi:hypothetical protein
MQNGKMNQQIYLTPFAILSKARRTNISPEASSRESGNPGRVRDINVTLWLGSFFVACFLTYMLR